MNWPVDRSRRFGGFVFPLALCLFVSANVGHAQSALDLEGKSFNPLNSGLVTVLIFVRQDCPISSRYAPTIQQLSSEYQKSARFYLVFPDKSQDAASIRAYLHDFNYSIAALRDPDHVLVKKTRAQFTPEAAVFDAKQSLIYHGRIDDLYFSIGRSRPAPTTHELKDAIESAVAGRPAAKKEVAGVGCFISDIE